MAGLRVFFLAQLGKYLPGGIWNLVAQVDMARDLRIPARQAATATFLAVALSVIAALLVAGVTLPFAIPGLISDVLVGVPRRARPRRPAAPAGGRVVERAGLPDPAPARDADPADLDGPDAGDRCCCCISWVLLGLHFGALVQGLGGSGASLWLMSIGIFALAWVAGFLVLVAPAGAGVREAALVLGSRRCCRPAPC